MSFFLDVAPVAGGVGILAAVAFFFILLAVALVAFKMLRRTVKMAVRVAIFVLILIVAIAGSIALWAVSSGGSAERSRPTRQR